jgi:hypothetical protein
MVEVSAKTIHRDIDTAVKGRSLDSCSMTSSNCPSSIELRFAAVLRDILRAIAMSTGLQDACPERLRLWTLYDGALKAWAGAVHRYTNEAECGVTVCEAHEYLEQCRAEIRKHSATHGCDPLASEVLKD